MILFLFVCVSFLPEILGLGGQDLRSHLVPNWKLQIVWNYSSAQLLSTVDHNFGV